MGFGVPSGVVISGAVDGAVSYSNTSGLSGEVSIQNAVTKLPDIAPISAAGADLKIMPDALHLEPATLQATGGGTLRVGGDYWWGTQRLVAAITVNEVAVGTLKNTAQAWFGAPRALGALSDGAVTGELRYAGGKEGGWSGDFQFLNATLTPPGVALPLKHAQGRVVFTPANLDLAHFTAELGEHSLQGSYRYNEAAKRQEHIHLELAETGGDELTAALEPAWREPGLLARLPFTKRSIPEWMAARNLEGDLTIGHFVVNKNDLGPVTSRFVWQGVNLQVVGLHFSVPDGPVNCPVNATGAVNLAARMPNARFKGTLKGYRWGGGSVDAEGELQGSGTGMDGLRSLHATGKFSGTELSLSLNEDFDKVSGVFDLSFDSGWPKLHLSNLVAVQGNDDWNGEALSNSDGQLVFDLGHGDKQLHIVSILAQPQPAASPVAVAGQTSGSGQAQR